MTVADEEGRPITVRFPCWNRRNETGELVSVKAATFALPHEQILVEPVELERSVREVLRWARRAVARGAVVRYPSIKLDFNTNANIEELSWYLAAALAEAQSRANYTAAPCGREVIATGGITEDGQVSGVTKLAEKTAAVMRFVATQPTGQFLLLLPAANDATEEKAVQAATEQARNCLNLRVEAVATFAKAWELVNTPEEKAAQAAPEQAGNCLNLGVEAVATFAKAWELINTPEEKAAQAASEQAGNCLNLGVEAVATSAKAWELINTPEEKAAQAAPEQAGNCLNLGVEAVATSAKAWELINTPEEKAAQAAPEQAGNGLNLGVEAVATSAKAWELINTPEEKAAQAARYRLHSLVLAVLFALIALGYPISTDWVTVKAAPAARLVGAPPPKPLSSGPQEVIPLRVPHGPAYLATPPAMPGPQEVILRRVPHGPAYLATPPAMPEGERPDGTDLSPTRRALPYLPTPPAEVTGPDPPFELPDAK